MSEGEGVVFDLQRAMDLIRFCRAELHDANLIDDKEYADLCAMGKESVARLEGYDKFQARIAELEKENKRLASALQSEQDYLNSLRGSRAVRHAERDFIDDWNGGGS